MKPRRFFFRSTQLFGAPIRVGTPLALGFSFILSGLGADAGDILRGGSSFTRGNGRKGANIDTPTPAAADAARANARDSLARTTRTLQAMKAMQQAARNAARKGGNHLGKNPANPAVNLPKVPNGLGVNGLQISSSLPSDPTQWTGAKLPTQEKTKGRTQVTIKQTEQNALLHWDTFNVGKRTTLTFDQTKGGENSGQWIAFNQIADPTANPTQILGNIKADGQIYIVNPNGIIFGGSSQVNARGLTVSSLPINTNLIDQGLLNNRDAQFLFSGLKVPGGPNGTPDFDPEATPSGKFGDIEVREGAILKSPAGSGGNGGRIMLVGANVSNKGSISTENGQTILAAGLQVAVAAHNPNDPSLRGLDVWVGDVGDYAGTLENSGIIESLTGSVSLTGKSIIHSGIIESSTSVALNGRIDIKASYGAVANPNFDVASGVGKGGPMFLNQFTGSVSFGENSVTRILPDYSSKKAVPGTALPERSQINVEGLAVHFGAKSNVFAPNAKISVRTGAWTYRDADGNRTIFDADGRVEPNVNNHFSGPTQRFVHEDGQIYVDRGATISVAGSVDVFVPLAQNILEIELRGAEMADSPLQRDSELRGRPLTVDLRKTGVYNGKFWVGTPLGDVTGLAGLIARNAAQLTVKGGDISFQAGGSIVVREGAVVDVSGGYLRHEAGVIRTSALWKDGRLVAMENATPDQVYDGVFNGKSTFTSEKWGISKTFSTPLLSGHHQNELVEGAAGGTLSLTAPSMALDGKLRGITVTGDQQRSTPPAASGINIRFEADKPVVTPGSNTVQYIKHSPAPPVIRFSNSAGDTTVHEFSLTDGVPAALPDARVQTVTLSTDLLDEYGFGSLSIYNPDGDIVVPQGVKLRTEPLGSISLAGANISVDGKIIARGGNLSFTTYNISPGFLAEDRIVDTSERPFPSAVEGRGLFTLGRRSVLSTAGIVTDDRNQSSGAPLGHIITDGGSVSIESFNASLAEGSVIDVSGGVHVSDKSARSYGKGGSISIVSGTDKGFPDLTGGKLTLGSTLRGYSGGTGGSLSIQSGPIEIGGTANPDVLHLGTGFFREGGFTSFSLNGFGAAADGNPGSYTPGITIAGGVRIRPRATSLIAVEDANGSIVLREIVHEKGLRSPVNLAFTASGVDDPYTIDILEIRGDLRMEAGSSIVADPGASVAFKAGTITLLGSVVAPGGKISVSGNGQFPLAPSQRAVVTEALPTVHFGETARLSTAGTVLLKPDPYGRRTGTVLAGGSITVSGNILAEKGAVMDVSGASGVLDIHPAGLATASTDTLAPGLTSDPLAVRGIATRIHSNAGTLSLTGSEMLVSDATLLGSATGGAAGGTLSVFSGRYYPQSAPLRTSADINLIVTQSGDIIQDPTAEMGVGIGLPDSLAGMGYFSLDRFQEGGFSSLGLGGNIEFRGNIDLRVPGSLRLAAGGVIQTSDTVNIRASYLAVGQGFRNPANPDDIFFPFRKEPALPTSEHNFAPTFGSGSISLSAKLVDVGTLSLQNIGSTRLTAVNGGDLRGNGTLSAAGDLVLSAGRIYPTSASSFSIFAYDHAEGAGSVTIRSTGKVTGTPMSAGGSLAVYASEIVHRGVLQAPLGSITLGWDGGDLDPNDADLDTPIDIIAGSTIAAPISSSIVLGRGSLVSVSAAGGKDDAEWLAPFGISPDGRTWIDPRGVNVTLSGLPGKSITIAGESVTMAPGATADLRGGGDLLATRWIAGNGGSMDLLGSGSTPWSGGNEYQAGDLVTYNGQTWSSRVRHSGQTPQAGLYWSKLPQSYAILPASSIAALPFTTFNTGSNAGALGGDPGFSNNSLRLGDTITLEASRGVPAGTYVLLPSRYALLPGAYLVTPKGGTGLGTVKTSEGAHIVSGYLNNRFNGSAADPATVTRFEIASSKVVNNRVTYQTLTANEFLAAAADENGAGTRQRLPGDAGHASIHGTSALRLAGKMRTKSPGLGATVDVSSLADITISNGSNPATGAVVLDSAVLNSWKAASLLVGGLRRTAADGTTVVDVRTQHLTLDNPGGSLTGSDVILASSGTLDITSGSSISSNSATPFTADVLHLTGDGALLRASADRAAIVNRTVTGSSGTASLSIGSSAAIAGASVIIDSTHAASLSPETSIQAQDLTLAAGQISVVLDGHAGPLVGSEIAPHLTLGGRTLDVALGSENLTLRSYRSIDFYGSGTFGSDSLRTLTLSNNGLRGFSDAGTTVIAADVVNLGNPGSIAAPSAGGGGTSELSITADTIRFGQNAFQVFGFRNLILDASREILVSGTGSFSTAGNLRARTPLITGEAGATHSIHAAGNMTLARAKGTAGTSGGLGAILDLSARSIAANANILLPSGKLSLRATHGDLRIGGHLSVEGSTRTFNDVTRHASAGSITLESVNGDVVLTNRADVSVSAAAAGGNAGSLTVRAARGIFSNQGTLAGTAASAFDSGRFSLDAGSLPGGSSSFAAINSALDSGGFNQSRDFRFRTGDITVGGTIASRHFSLATDQGSIRVLGTIDASGDTGGSIALAAHGDLTLAAGAVLNASAARFNSAGKGGSILLEAGTQHDGLANESSQLELNAGSRILLGVAEYVPGSYTTPGSSAFDGKFTGTLHLRAPRTPDNAGLQIGAIRSTISGASSVIAEGYKVYEPANGVMDIALRNQIHSDSTAFLGAAGTDNANEAAIRGNLLAGAPNPAALDALLVVAPGVEIINRSGDLVLGLANNTSTGSANTEALAAADWDLSSFRYGSRSAPGVLTLRAQGDLVFNNTLSDGFTPTAQGSAQNFADNGHSQMWLATLMTVSDTLPVNTQSWSYRLAAGSDTDSSNFRSVLTPDELTAGKGSLIVGEFYPAVPNTLSSGASAGIGSNGQTADTIRISTSSTNRGTRFEVVRTGTGDITVSAGRDIQLRNQFASIYTAGVALPVSTTIFSENDFVVPIIPTAANRHPSQQGTSGTLGAIQQIYQPAWSMAGGDISLSAGANIGRYTLVNGLLTVDSSRQMPTNWLYRRGYVDPVTGLFASDGGFGSNTQINNATNVNDAATSTTWWIDFSNFFQGVGTLGGGNIHLAAGNDVINVDAVAPTNARMAGRTKNPDFGIVPDAPEFLNLAPDEAKLHELGGGDVTITVGRNIDGGIYYVERGKGTLDAGGSITTNAARSPSLGILDGSQALDPLTWLPTTLFVGKSRFDVTATGDVLLGPVTNPFLLPQGINNKFWYKTYFNTFSPDAGVDVLSIGGNVTHRTAINLPGGTTPVPVLGAWFDSQNLFAGQASELNASNRQPWLRLAEMDLSNFGPVFKLFAPNLRSTAMGGNIHLVGDITLAPSSRGDLQLVADGGIIGLNRTGSGVALGKSVQTWSASTVSMSDAAPDSIPGILNPLAYQTLAGRSKPNHNDSEFDILGQVSLSLAETGSYTGDASTQRVRGALHDASLLHRADPRPVVLYASTGDITGLTLFTPKKTRIIAGRDINDTSFYLQNLAADDISLISAGRDIIPFLETSEIRTVAGNILLGNFIGDPQRNTALGGVTKAMAGDIRISGPGVLQVISDRNLDLGDGPNFSDGTGTGITSIGNLRNPYLPFGGADIIALAGVTGKNGSGPADGLSSSSMDVAGFISEYLRNPDKFDSEYLDKTGLAFDDASLEQQAIVALEKFYALLRSAGQEAAKTGKYDTGYAAVKALFGKDSPSGDLNTRSREIRTTSGGSISLALPGGGIAMASEVFGNPLTPPGIVTEFGGAISTFTDQSVDIGQARIFTLRGGDITMWSSKGNIAAGTSPRTVVTAPPTRVVMDLTSANVQTDLGGLATGGGIGVLATVEGVEPGNVALIAPKGFVDAGDAGIQASGNITIAANTVLNAGNISSGGTTSGSSVSAPAAPSVSTVTSASNAAAASTTAAPKPADNNNSAEPPKPATESPSIYTVQVIGYGGSQADEEEDEEQNTSQP